MPRKRPSSASRSRKGAPPSRLNPPPAPSRPAAPPRPAVTPRVELPAATTQRPAAAPTAYDRFQKSMVMDLDKWREGTSYELDLLKELTPSELASVRAQVAHGSDWRDAEALAAIARLESPGGSAAAAIALRRKFECESEPLITRLRAGDELDELGESVDFVPLIETMLDASVSDSTVLSRVTDWIEWRHPDNDDRVRRKILRLLLSTRDRSAVGLAAIACVVYGLSTSQYDWALRPFWLRFAEPDQHDDAIAELLQKVGLTRRELLA